MLDNLLFYRLVILNFLGACVVFWGYQMGYVTKILARDETGVVWIIVAILVLGVMFVLSRGWKVSKMLNELKKIGHVNVLKVRKMPHKNKYLEFMAGWAVLVGLFGNALGFVIALGSRDDLLTGAGVAFGSTVVGILTALWLEINFSFLSVATANLLEDAEYASESAK
jgi:hypothetical protein